MNEWRTPAYHSRATLRWKIPYTMKFFSRVGTWSHRRSWPLARNKYRIRRYSFGRKSTARRRGRGSRHTCRGRSAPCSFLGKRPPFINPRVEVSRRAVRFLSDPVPRCAVSFARPPIPDRFRHTPRVAPSELWRPGRRSPGRSRESADRGIRSAVRSRAATGPAQVRRGTGWVRDGRRSRASTSPRCRPRSERGTGGTGVRAGVPVEPSRRTRSPRAWSETHASRARSPRSPMDRLDDRLGEDGRVDLFRPGHLPRQVIRDDLRGDDLADGIAQSDGRVLPSEVLEHHHACEHLRGRVHLVHPGVFRRAPVDGLEHRVGVAHVPARRDAESADLGRGGVAQVVAVQIGRGEDIVFLRPQEELLEHVVRNHVFNQNRIGRNLAVVLADRVLPRDRPIPEFIPGDLVPPGAERSLRVLHDVPLVDEGHGPASIPNGIADCLTNQALRTRLADGFNAND